MKSMADDHWEDATVKWYIQQTLAGVSTQYNQWADFYWTNKQCTMNWHFCLLDAGFNVLQYSTKYTELQKYNEAWVGFYPSTYEIQKVVDEAGTTEAQKIVDTDELNRLCDLNPGSSFYFAGLNYKTGKVDKRTADNWKAFGLCKENNEMLVVRKFKTGWVIFQLAQPGHKTR